MITASRGIKGDVDVDVDGGITGVDALDCFPLEEYLQYFTKGNGLNF